MSFWKNDGRGDYNRIASDGFYHWKNGILMRVPCWCVVVIYLYPVGPPQCPKLLLVPVVMYEERQQMKSSGSKGYRLAIVLAYSRSHLIHLILFIESTEKDDYGSTSSCDHVPFV